MKIRIDSIAKNNFYLDNSFFNIQRFLFEKYKNSKNILSSPTATSSGGILEYKIILKNIKNGQLKKLCKTINNFITIVR
jgi:hypothetical protein